MSPEARMDGPAELGAGLTARFRFIIRTGSPDQPLAGFNVAASGGALGTLPEEGERLDGGELTHTAPKVLSGGEAVWEFTWTAPAQSGEEKLYGAGLSGNGNGTPSGDATAVTTIDMTVVAVPTRGDGNCDGRISAADLPALLAAWAMSPGESCELADADCDGSVDTSDVALVIAALFDLSPGSFCIAPGAGR